MPVSSTQLAVTETERAKTSCLVMRILFVLLQSHKTISKKFNQALVFLSKSSLDHIWLWGSVPSFFIESQVTTNRWLFLVTLQHWRGKLIIFLISQTSYDMTIYKIKAVDKSQFFNATFNFVPCFLEHLKKISDERTVIMWNHPMFIKETSHPAPFKRPWVPPEM